MSNLRKRSGFGKKLVALDKVGVKIGNLPQRNLNTGSDQMKDQKFARQELNKKSKEKYERENELPQLVVTKSIISLYSNEEMKKLAVCQITDAAMEGSNSLYDPRMGNSNPINKCGWCEQYDCPGHYGYIDFGCRIPHPLFMREIMYVLHIVCNKCGMLLIDKVLMKEKGILALKGSRRLRELESYSKKFPCLNRQNNEDLENVLPCGTNTKYEMNLSEGIFTFTKQKNRADNIEDNLMDINEIYKILNMISNEDAVAMGFAPGTHPRNFILEGMLVCPNVARVKIESKFLATSDKQTLTPGYKAILSKVKEIKNKNGINTPSMITELYKAVQAIMSTKEDDSNIKKSDVMSVGSLIQGKEGLIRSKMVGKRNDYAARTVSSPDPSLNFGEIRCPLTWAPLLTKPIKVNDINRKYLMKLLEQGKIEKITSKTGLVRIVRKNKLNSYRLVIGEIVERHLQDGDRVAANRQPNLSKYSMFGFHVVLGKQLTIGLHLSYTSPLNADFDGDENNAWDARDLEVEAETEYIHNVRENVMYRASGRPVMGLVMNSTLGSYILSNPELRIDNNVFERILLKYRNKEHLVNVFERIKPFGIHPRSGRALFSSLLPAGFSYEKGQVVIIDGVLISGNLTKGNVGPVSRSIIQELWRDYQHHVVCDFLTDAPIAINAWLLEYGFSVGIGDCLNYVIDKDGKEIDMNNKVIEDITKEIRNKVEGLGGKVQDRIEEDYREVQIKSIVNVGTGQSNKEIAAKLMTKDNPIKQMTELGSASKGASFNVIQIMALVGQQNYRGERFKNSIDNNRRCLPCYDRNGLNPEFNGFIPTSYLKGLNAPQLLFLQAGGREGIIDTALNTAKTGELNREMIKALENIIIYQDGSMRDTTGNLYFQIYNSGYDPAEMIDCKRYDNILDEKYNTIVDFNAMANRLNYTRGWIRNDISDKINKNEEINEPFDEMKNAKIIKNAKKYVPKPKRVQNNKFGKINTFEKARLIATRAIQIENNAPPLVITDSIDSLKIAEEEYFQGKNPLFVIRNYPTGTVIVYPTIDNI